MHINANGRNTIQHSRIDEFSREANDHCHVSSLLFKPQRLLYTDFLGLLRIQSYTYICRVYDIYAENTCYTEI